MSCAQEGVCSARSFSTIRSWDVSAIAVTVFLAGVLLILGTRMKTSLDFSTIQGDKLRRPPILPYSIPYVGHAISLLWKPDEYIESAKQISPSNIFALRVLGRQHNVVGSPALVKKVFEEREAFTKDWSPIQLRLLRKFVAMPSEETDVYMDILRESLFDSDSQSQSALRQLMAQLQSSLPDLLSFNPSPIDQEPWERASKLQLDESHDTATVDLLTLTQTFLTHVTINNILSPSLLGQNPDVAPLLSQLSAGFVALFSGVTRTLPHPSLPKAHIARLQLLQQLTPFCAALRSAAAGMDPGPVFRDLLEDGDAVTPLLADLQQRWATLDLSLSGRASAMALLLWQLNAPHALAFWLLVHALATPGVADALRAESAPFVRARRPPKMLGFAQPVTLRFDERGLAAKCPVLRCCYLETVRLYGREWWSGRAATDYVVVEGKGLSWFLKAGEWVHVPFWLANKDEGLFHPDPSAWRWERHIDYVKAVMCGEGTRVEDQVFDRSEFTPAIHFITES